MPRLFSWVTNYWDSGLLNNINKTSVKIFCHILSSLSVQSDYQKTALGATFIPVWRVHCTLYSKVDLFLYDSVLIKAWEGRAWKVHSNFTTCTLNIMYFVEKVIQLCPGEMILCGQGSKSSQKFKLVDWRIILMMASWSTIIWLQT